MRHLYAQPVVDIEAVTRLLSTSTNTASALIADLVTQGVLVEMTGQRRNRFFLFHDYLHLFRK
jgi:Fic family protein